MKYLFLFISIVLFFPFAVRADNEYTLSLENSNSEYASITDANQQGLDINSDFSICFWAKPDETGLSGDIVAKLYNYRIFFSGGAINGQIDFDVHDSTCINADGHLSRFRSNAAILPTGSWNHFCGVYDISSNDMLFYKNGDSVAFTEYYGITTPGALCNNANTFMIGYTYDYYDGLLDDVKIFDYQLTEQEVEDLMNCKGSTDGISEWNFENSLVDENTTNSNDLTDNNSVSFQSASLPYIDNCAGSPPAGGSTAATSTVLYSGDISFITETEYCFSSSTNSTPTRTIYRYWHIPFFVIMFFTWCFGVLFNRIIIQLLIRKRK